MKNDSDILTHETIEVLDKYEALAEHGDKSNLHILAVNNILNILKSVIKNQEKPEANLVGGATAGEIIADELLMPMPSPGKKRLMTEATFNEAKRIRQAIINCDLCGEPGYPPMTIGEFKQALRDADALLSSQAEMGKFYKNTIAQALSVIEGWQQGKLWSQADDGKAQNPDNGHQRG